MYRNAKLRRYQYYVNPNWSGTYPILLPVSLLSKVASIKVVFMQAPVSQALGGNPVSYMHMSSQIYLKPWSPDRSNLGSHAIHW